MPKNARPENLHSCQWGKLLVRHTTSISRPNRVKLSLQPLAQNFGLHGSADSSWGNPLLPFEQEIIKTGKFNAMKLLSRENPLSIDWLSQNGVNVSTVIVRLMLQDDARATPTSARADTGEKVMAFYSKGVRHFELPNEPNTNIEGLGTYWTNGTTFAAWFIGLANILKKELPDAKIGWPGLSPGGTIPGVRTDWGVFFNEAVAAGALGSADWIGCHCYWTTPGDISNIAAGAHWKNYLRYSKPINVTEYSNPAPGVLKTDKAHQYLTWFNTLTGVDGAYSFVSSASSGFPYETWTVEMAVIVGNR